MMQQTIHIALTAYIAAARNFSYSGEFNEVFSAMYADDADYVEEALTQYMSDNSLVTLQDSLRELDDDGYEQLLAYLLKHNYNDAHDALK